MKASEYVRFIQEQIDLYGDLQVAVKTNNEFSADLYEEGEVLFYPEIVHSSASFYNSRDKKVEVDSVFIVAINNRGY